MSMDTPKRSPKKLDNKELRLENPTGWLYLTKHDSIPIIVDSLLGLPPKSEFNKTELAEHSGVSRQSVSKHIDRLLELNVLEEVPNTSPTRYRMPQSAVVKELFELNSALNAAGLDNDPSEGNDSTGGE
jgi:DNA-binding transcriptional ArsR family regulator